MIFNDSCTDLTPPRGAPGVHLGRPSPRPPAPGLLLLLYTLLTTFTQTTLKLTVFSLLTRTPAPSSLGVGGFKGLRPLPPTPKKNLEQLGLQALKL